MNQNQQYRKKGISKKILWLENGDFIGGAEHFSLDFFKHYNSQFLQITLLCNDKGDFFQQAGKYESLQVKPFDIPRLKPFGFFTVFKFFLAIKNLLSVVYKGEFDHIHVNTVRGFLILGIASFFISRHIVLTFFSHDFTLPRWASFLFKKRYLRVFSCSTAVAENLYAHGYKKYQVQVIENGINPPSFESISTQRQNPPRFGVLGRIDRWKGQLIFVQAAKKFLETQRAHFFVIGEPSSHDPQTQDYYQEIKDYIERYHLEEFIHLIGYKPTKEALSEIDILVHAPIEREPFGRVPIEGACAHRPLLIADIGTPSRIFEDGKYALLFEAGNPLDLAKKMKQLSENTYLGDNLAKNAYKMVCSRFDLQNIVDDLSHAFLNPER